jgi:hypothetical protein
MLLARSLLLLLGELIKEYLLHGGQHTAEFLHCPLQLLAPVRLNRLHELLHPFLAFPEDSVNRLVLLGCQIQLALHTAQELESHYTRRSGLRRSDGVYGTLRAAVTAVLNMLDQQTPGHHARAEDYHRGEDKFPGVHRAESMGCS